jgi:DNA-binding protein HU-beta
MNQRKLSRALAKKFAIPRRQSVRILHFLVDKTTEALGQGERFTLQGFGVFRRATRAAKKVRHPKTGKTITIPARLTISFRPAPALVKRLK